MVLGERGDSAQGSDPSEAETQGVAHFATPLVVEHEVAHDRPDPATRHRSRAPDPSPPGRRHTTRPSRNSGLSSRAVRSAVWWAHPVVTTCPSTRTMTPHPARTNQPARVVTATPRPAERPSADASSEPTTATPRVAPTWREVEAMAEATPA